MAMSKSRDNPNKCNVNLFWALFLVGLFLLNPFLASAFPSLAHDNPKYQEVKTIYERIVRAIGDLRPPPELIITPLNSKGGIMVAGYDPRQNAIVVEERIYDLCAEFKSDAPSCIAVVVSHELAHFYKDHNWGGDFGSNFADLDIGSKIKEVDVSLEDVLKLEAQADDFGGFYGYLAGFNNLDIAPDVLESIYTSYKIDANISGYPGLVDRKEIAVRSKEKLNDLIPIFNSANWLLLIKKNETAAFLFDHIANSFPSREIFNNAGVARALEAIELSNKNETRFIYPLEFDSQTRLSRENSAFRRGFSLSMDAKRLQLINEAQGNFEKAFKLDPDYYVAVLNLASVYELKQEREMALAFANKGLKLADKVGDMIAVANAHIVRGIALANEGETAKAKDEFKEAEKKSVKLASLNLSILEKNIVNVEKSPDGNKSALIFKKESIEGIQAKDYKNVMSHDSTSFTVIPKKVGSQQIIIGKRNSEFWDGFLVNLADQNIFFLRTKQGYEEASARGIKIGSSSEDVYGKYGQPNWVMAGQREHYLVYVPNSILFRMDEKNQVDSWITFFFDEE